MAIEIPFDQLGAAMGDIVKASRFAEAKALTRTAFACRKAAQENMEKRFTLRNRWSQSSVRVTMATPEKREAEVFVKDAYLADQELGRSRPAKSGGVNIPSVIREAAGIPFQKVIPKTWRRNTLVGRGERGNKAMRGSKKIKGNRPFIATIKNTQGVWVRAGAARTPINLLYVIKEGPQKTKKREWYRTPVERTYDKEIGPQYQKAIDEEIERFWQKRGI